MRIALSLALLCSGAALPLEGQEPIAVTPTRGICQGISNTSDCAQAIEGHQISRSTGRVRRVEDVLEVRLDDGRRLLIPSESTETWPSRLYFLGRLVSINHYVLWEQYPEGNTIRLVNARSGKATFVDDMPLVSPAARWFATASLDLDAGYNPNRVVVWRLDGDTLAQEASFDSGDGGPDSLTWLSGTSFRFTRVVLGTGGSLRFVSRDTVRLVGGEWRLGR